jgi:tetratricopeptide (TPR) repeat protein
MAMAVLVVCVPAGAQTLDPAATTEPASKPAKDLSLNGTLKGLDSSMSRDEIEALVKKANENRLKAERKLVAADLGGQFYDPNDVDEALALLDKDAKNSQQDNIDHICKAYARVDAKFASVYKLFAAGKWPEAEAAGKAIAATQSTWLGAAKAFVYASTLESAGKGEEAAEAYLELVTNMSDRISFASESAMRVARLYERIGRKMYAMQAYSFLLKNYGLTIDEKTFDEIYAKVKKLQEMYGDPMGTVAKMMSEVKERLAVVDSGPDTQLKEKDILALLDDLVKTAEEQDNSSQSSSQNKKKKSGKQKDEGQGQGEEKGIATGKGKPPARPSSGAKESHLRNGDTTRAGKGTDVHDSGEKGDWSSLPPEQQQKLEQIRQRMISERYRDIISDYHKRIAEEK